MSELPPELRYSAEDFYSIDMGVMGKYCADRANALLSQRLQACPQIFKSDWSRGPYRTAWRLGPVCQPIKKARLVWVEDCP